MRRGFLAILFAGLMLIAAGCGLRAVGERRGFWRPADPSGGIL